MTARGTIIVEKRSVYGNDLVYPVCRDAQRFADLTGQKTLGPRAIRLIRELGFTIDQKTPEPL